MQARRMSQLLVGLLFCGTGLAQPSASSTREMNDMNWMEFREWVPHQDLYGAASNRDSGGPWRCE